MDAWAGLSSKSEAKAIPIASGSTTSLPSTATPAIPPASHNQPQPTVTKEVTGWRKESKFSWIDKFITQLDDAAGRNDCRVPLGHHCPCVNKSVGWSQIYQDPPNPILESSAYTVIDPGLWQRKRVYFWIPEQFFVHHVKHVYCPYCKSMARRKGWNPSGPRHVSGITDDYYILCRQYDCSSCRRSFQGYNAEVVKQLPPEIQYQLPADLQRSTGLDKDLVSLLKRQVVKGQSFADFRAMISECKSEKYWRDHHEYVSAGIGVFTRYNQRSETAPGGMFLKTPSQIKKFGDFLYIVPTVESLKKAYMSVSMESYQTKVRKIMSLTGKVLSGDHTFAVAKVPHAGHQRIFEAMYSVQNEYNQIIGYYMTMTKSLNEVNGDISAIAGRYDKGEGPDLFFTDSCCKERQYLEQVFTTLQGSAAEYDRLEPVSAKSRPKIVYAKTVADVEGVCDAMQNSQLIGITYQQSWTFSGASDDGQVQVVTLTNQVLDDNVRSMSLVISLSDWPAIQCRALLDLLSDRQIVKIGEDGTGQVLTALNVITNGLIELSEFTKDIDTTATVEYLVARFAGIKLNDQPFLKYATWGGEALSQSLLSYASVRGYGLIIVYQKLTQLESSEISEIPVNLKLGTFNYSNNILTTSFSIHTRESAFGYLPFHEKISRCNNTSAVPQFRFNVARRNLCCFHRRSVGRQTESKDPRDV
jgi:hypothetical protein